MDNRKLDLEELYRLRSQAKTRAWQDIYDQTIDKILRETQVTRSLRDNLIKAIRGNDIRAIKRYNEEITAVMRAEGRIH